VCPRTFDQCRSHCLELGGVGDHSNPDKSCTNMCSRRTCISPETINRGADAAPDKSGGTATAPSPLPKSATAPSPAARAGAPKDQPIAAAPAGANKPSPSPAADLTRQASRLVESGALNEGIALLDQAIAADPQYGEAWRWRGMARNRSAQWVAAIADLTRAIELQPKNPNALLSRGGAYIALNNLGAAMDDFNKAGELAPYAPGPFSWRGVIYSRQGEQDRALESINKAIKLDPTFRSAYQNLGEVYTRMQRYDQAAEAYSKYLATEPSIPAYTARGYDYLSLGDRPRAQADFTTALKTNPNYVPALIGQGRVFADGGSFNDAIASYNQALTLQPNNVDALLRRARVYELQANFAAARTDLQKVLQVAPAHPTASAGLDRLDVKGAIAKGAPAANRTDRVALVIGNSRYGALNTLQNTENDAKLVAAALKTLGFKSVRVVLDGKRDDMLTALKALASDAATADWAMVYYAGHGLELNGSNYLAPVDVRYENDSDIPAESIPLDNVLAAVGDAKSLRLVVLDACRENPFAEDIRKAAGMTSVGSGLARIEPEAGTLVAFATKHGDIAVDGTGGDSPFALALTNRMKTPGLEINQIFRLIHDDVLAATDRKQEPFTYGQLSARALYFRQ
jgi:tetratricopeptide (TPR) repeat protein